MTDSTNRPNAKPAEAPVADLKNASSQEPSVHELSYWRDMIDRTDANLRQLIAKRMSCAREVARIKSEHEKRNPEAPVIYYRPGREAQMMRKLSREGSGQAGGFPVPGLIQIWRELISASIEHQADGLRVAVDDETGFSAARAHFGACSDVKLRSNPLDDLAQGKVMVALVSWQTLLTCELGAGQSVIAALPFAGSPTHAVIGAQQPERSGDDLAVYKLAGPVCEEPSEAPSESGAALLLASSGEGHLLAYPANEEPANEAPAANQPVNAETHQLLGLYARPLI